MTSPVHPALPTEDGRQVRVLMVANTLPPFDLSGAGEQVVQLSSGLRDLGFAVEILGRGRGGARGPKVLFPLMVVFPALHRLRSGGIDVIQLHESDGGLLALALARCRRWLPRFRSVALLQVSYDEEARAVRPLCDPVLGEIARPVAFERRFRRFRIPLQRLLGRLTARSVDVVLVCSRQTGREVESDYGVVGTRVVPNAMAEQPIDRNRQPESQNGQFLFIGRLRIRKGVEVLVHALAKLRDEGLILNLRIAGDGERRRSLEELVTGLGLAEQVSFLGRLSRVELDSELASCAALVVPSTYEGMPLVILEAMEARVPVVASAVSGIPEVVESGESGWLVPPENVAALAEVLRQAALNPDERKRRGMRGRERLQSFRPRAVAKTWCRALGLESAPVESPAGEPVEATRGRLDP